MHFEILVEDISGKIDLEILVPKIINTEQHTFHIHSYKGIGHIPQGLKSTSDPKKRILLDQLPRLIQPTAIHLPVISLIIMLCSSLFAILMTDA